jgi:putative ABC transport system ATP-binding protein
MELQDIAGPRAPPPASQPVIRMRDVHKNYQMGDTQVHALRGVSFEIAAGEFVAVMGASGSGKSTLMNIIGCLDRPSSGQYFLRDTDIAELDNRQLAHIRSRELGFVFQNYNLIARTTALENVALPTLYTRIRRQEALERAAEGLALVGLAERADHYPSQMSGGQQQRVAIARALVNHPSILLADEPTGSLDSATSLEIMDLLVRLNTGGLTIVMVTHESDIARFGRRIIVVRDGQIQRDEKCGS